MIKSYFKIEQLHFDSYTVFSDIYGVPADTVSNVFKTWLILMFKKFGDSEWRKTMLIRTPDLPPPPKVFDNEYDLSNGSGSVKAENKSSFMNGIQQRGGFWNTNETGSDKKIRLQNPFDLKSNKPNLVIQIFEKKLQEKMHLMVDVC